MKLGYMEMKRQLAESLRVDQEDVRCNDFTNLWCVKIGKDREVCVIAPDAESAASVLRGRV